MISISKVCPASPPGRSGVNRPSSVAKSGHTSGRVSSATTPSVDAARTGA